MDQPIASANSSAGRHRPPWRRRAGLGLALLSAMGFGTWLLVRADAGTTASNAVVPPLVSVIVPSIGEVPASVSLTGLINARNDVPIGNEGDSARITEVLVEAGDHVRKGQVLARLSSVSAHDRWSTTPTASLAEVRADSAMAQAESARAQQGLDLFSTEETERRRTVALAAPRPRSRPLRRNWPMRATAWRTRVIVAPADGIVLTRTAEVGQIAVPGSNGALSSWPATDRSRCAARSPKSMCRGSRSGQKANVRLDGVARTFTGTVWQIGAVIDPATRQGTVRIALPVGGSQPAAGSLRARRRRWSAARVGAILPQTAVLER